MYHITSGSPLYLEVSSSVLKVYIPPASSSLRWHADCVPITVRSFVRLRTLDEWFYRSYFHAFYHVGVTNYAPASSSPAQSAAARRAARRRVSTARRRRTPAAAPGGTPPRASARSRERRPRSGTEPWTTGPGCGRLGRAPRCLGCLGGNRKCY